MPLEPNWLMKLPLEENSTIRPPAWAPIPFSTQMLPLSSRATAVGESSCPLPGAEEPKAFRNAPEEENSWMRLLPVSETKMSPELSETTPPMPLNWPLPVPSEPIWRTNAREELNSIRWSWAESAAQTLPLGSTASALGSPKGASWGSVWVKAVAKVGGEPAFHS